jgi:hypothetical protein
MFEQILKIEISANVVAWYAAIISTTGLIINIYKAYQDRARVKIKYEPDMYIYGDALKLTGYKPDTKYLSISVINEGRRPIRIEKATLKIIGKKGYFILVDSFSERRNKVITEESPTTTFFAEQSQIDMENVYCVLVEDGTGKSHIKYINKLPTYKIICYWIKNILHSMKKQ